jgi:transcriptional regulator with XRE-family HTH domain
LSQETGVLQSRISELENDKRVKIDVWSVQAMCRRLGITVEYLLEGAGQANADEAEAVALLRHADPTLRNAAMNALRGMLYGKDRSAGNRH